MARSRDGSASVSVACAGAESTLSDAAGIDVVGAVGDSSASASEADCVVATEPGGGLDVLASVAETSVPTVLYDREGDPAVAAAATRLGVTEYVTDAALDGETLADRVVAVVGADGTRAASALESLHDVATDRSLSFAEKTDRLLDVGRERLDLDVGFLAEVDGDTSSVVAARGESPGVEAGASLPLEDTFCKRTVERGTLLGIEETDLADPATEATGFRCYLGGVVETEDGLYGTLCFAGTEPRGRAFSQRERRFVELLVEWLSHEIARDRSEQTLRRYKAIHETVEEMVFVVGEGTTVELVTTPLLERFGYEQHELVGSPLTTLLGDDAVRKGYEAFESLQEGAESVTIETTLPTVDGESVPVEVDLSLLSSSTQFKGLVGVVHDRTELNETYAELESQRDRFQSLFDQLPDAVVDAEFVDGEPYVRAVNPAFEEVFGYDEEAAVDEPVNDLIVPDEHWSTARDLDDGAADGSDNLAEVERLTADGRWTFLFRGFLYTTDDDTQRGFGIYTDITDRLEQERRLRVLHRVLRHNLRNEMTGVIGYADLLADTLEAPEHREYAERIHRQANDVAKLGEQVQRIEQALDRERRRLEVDPGAVATDVAAQYRESHPEATVRVGGSADDADAETDVLAVADDLLELAVGNLVENAIEHHEDTPTVDVTVATDGEWVDLTVADDGPGIPERERAIVGGDREITQLDHSRGLGLWVARWIVEGVGGQLRFGEADGEGAEVTLRLQRAGDAA